MSSREPVVVLRSNDICYLGIIRSCAAANVPVISIIFDWEGSGPWYSEHSRHFTESHTIPNPYEYPVAAAAALSEIGEVLKERFGSRLLVLGSSDTNLMFLRDNLEVFSEYFRFMGDRPLELGQFDLLDKGICSARFDEAEVAQPLSVSVSSLENIEEVLANMRFPCVYKPAVKDYRQSFYAAHAGNKAVSVTDASALRVALQSEVEAGFRLLVQEKVEFEGPLEEIPFYLYADKKGKIVQAATAIKEKLQPHPFGTATVLRLSYHPDLLAKAQAVVDALEYRGILMIEFIRDRKDGIWKVIEINPRPWLFVDFFRRCGLNYLACLFDDRDGRMPVAEQKVPENSDNVSPVHLHFSAACGDYLEKLPGPAKISDVVDWLESVVGTRSLAFLDPSDRAPGLAELSDFAAQWKLDSTNLVEAVDRSISDD